MKVAIVHEFLTKIGGAEKVLLAISEIFPDAPIYTLVYDEEGTRGLFKNKKIVPSSLQKYPRAIRMRPKLLLSKYSRAVEEFTFSEYDVVISSSNSFAHGIITKPSTFHFCYCHSPMRYVWDWYHEYLTENHLDSGLKSLFVRRILHQIRIWDKAASYRVDSWIANSSNVQKRIKKYYGFDSKIICPPVDISQITTTKDIPDDYYAIVSRLEPYKKIELAIEAFNENEKQLVVIGTGSNEGHLKSIAKKNIEFLGWQSDQSIYEYLRNAKALIFPGEDDFGITPVEAMACGRPVIAYKKGGTLETIIENKTGLFFEEQNAKSLNEAIDKLEKNYLRFTPSECRNQAEKFSLDNFKKEFERRLIESNEEFLKSMKKHEKS
jgi:glycosyltransferase involved in cell wall biosynthesis